MKLLAVCGFGVGSSMVLRMTLEKVAKELGVDAEIDNTDISSAKSMNPDAIFTSFELADEIKKLTRAKVYPIKKYMDKEEVKVSMLKLLDK